MKRKDLLLPALIIAAQHALFLALFPPILEPDSGGYVALGRALAGGLGFDSLHRLPGYPAFLGACYRLFGGGQLPVIIVQHLLGLAVFAGTLSLLPAGRARYWFTGLFFFDLLYASYQHAILAESLLSFCAVMSALEFRSYFKGGPAAHLLACGALLAAGTFVKPVLKLFPFAAALLVLLTGSRPPRLRAAGAAALLAAPLLAFGLWSWRNQARYGTFALLPFESLHYVGKVVMHPEFPEGSISKDIFLKRAAEAPGGMKQKIKSGVVFRVIDDLKAAGYTDEQVNAEFKQVYKLGVLRHPFLTARETLGEYFLFFFSAHNLFAKHSLQGKLPYSASEAIAKRDLPGLFLKVAVSLHPLYWAVFLLTAWFAVSRRRGLMLYGDGFAAYGLLFVLYLSSVTSLANEGLANYRCPAQPFLLFCSALMLAAWFPGAEERRN